MFRSHHKIYTFLENLRLPQQEKLRYIAGQRSGVLVRRSEQGRENKHYQKCASQFWRQLHHLRYLSIWWSTAQGCLAVRWIQWLFLISSGPRLMKKQSFRTCRCLASKVHRDNTWVAFYRRMLLKRKFSFKHVNNLIKLNITSEECNTSEQYSMTAQTDSNCRTPSIFSEGTLVCQLIDWFIQWGCRKCPRYPNTSAHFRVWLVCKYRR